MTEEINHSYDGGLYAELVRNRAFLDDAGSAAHWAAVQGDGAAAAIALDKSQPLNDTIPTSLRVEVTQASKGHAAGVANEGYWGIPVKPDTRYHASFYAKAAPGFGGPVTVSIQSNDGTTSSPPAPSPVWARRGSSTGDAPDRPRDADDGGAVRADGRAARHGLVQPRVAVPADVQEPAERLPARHHADDGGHEAEVPALPRRQLPGGGSDRRPLRVEEDARAAGRTGRDTSGRGVIGRPTASASTSSCCGPRTWAPSRCSPSTPATR